jgi:hypothetical protein
LLALALCYEAWGKNATAWALFQEAEAMAKAQGRKDRIAIAEARVRALETGLSFMTIELDTAAPKSVEVSLDGLRVSTAAFGVATAVNIGLHRVDAYEQGSVYFSQQFDVASKQRLVVKVPAPVAAATASEPAVVAQPSPATEADPTPRDVAAPEKASRKASLPRREPPSALERRGPHVMLGLGVTALLVGSYFGVSAWQGAREVEQGCPKDPCNPNLKPTHEASQRDAALSNWLIGLGAVTAAVGGYLSIRNANAQAGAGSFAVAAGPKGAGVIWSRSF